jgi:hypothetical protein
MFHCGNNGALLVSRHHTLPPVVATRERKLKGWARAVKGVLASDEGE